MSFFGKSIRNGVSIGLGAIVTFFSGNRLTASGEVVLEENGDPVLEENGDPILTE